MQGVMLSEAILWIDQTEYKHSISINVPPSSKDFRSGEWCAFGGTSYGRRKASQYVLFVFLHNLSGVGLRSTEKRFPARSTVSK